jgi:hypothetical protein
MSTEDRLAQEFNSLDAQQELRVAYIPIQVGKLLLGRPQ